LVLTTVFKKQNILNYRTINSNPDNILNTKGDLAIRHTSLNRNDDGSVTD